MNMTNALQIKIAVLSQVLARSITTMNNKYCNRLSSKIMHTQINIFLSREIVGDLWFIDDNNLVKTTLWLMEFALKATTSTRI
jgi:hypothetical protein